jgi:hypothetical protein
MAMHQKATALQRSAALHYDAKDQPGIRQDLETGKTSRSENRPLVIRTRPIWTALSLRDAPDRYAEISSVAARSIAPGQCRPVANIPNGLG